jgi:hypothetical protein
MVSYGTAALVIYFCIAFALWATPLGIGGEHSDQLNQYKNETMYKRPGLSMEEIITSWISPELLAGTAIVGVAAYLISGAIQFTIAATSIVFMANLLLTPLSLFSALSIPEPFNWLILGILNILLITAIFSFIRGKDF